MTVRSMVAAKHICRYGGWTITNLKLQKILYLAHMVAIGKTGKPLVHEQFEAWAYGPVEPVLYRAVKGFGSRPIAEYRFFNTPDLADGSEEKALLDESCAALIRKTPAQLVGNTHWPKGAWAKNYAAGIDGRVISDEDVIAEYKQRISR